MTEQEVAWTAGLFEGEGCIYIAPKQIRLQLSMTDIDVVHRFASLVKVGTIYHKGPLPADRKPQDLWCCSGTNAVNLLNLWLPWFGSRRTAKAIEAISVCLNNSSVPEFENFRSGKMVVIKTHSPQWQR